MIKLHRLDVIRASAPDVAAELVGIAAQINAQPSVLSQTQTTVGAAGTASALPATPTGYVEIVIDGTTYVLPFYAKD